MNRFTQPNMLLLFVLALGGCRAGGAQPEPPPAAAPSPAPATAPEATGNAALPVGYPQFPSISPDGSTIVFSWMGDLWSVAAAGGLATRLTAHPALERRSAFSPDGRMLAFESDREGARNLYVMPVSPGAGPGLLQAGTVRRATVSDRPQNLSGFSADGRSLLFSSTQEAAIHRHQRMFRVDLPDAEGRPATVRRLVNAFGSMPHESPDGSLVVFTRGRYDFTRPAYRGSGDMDLCAYSPADDRYRMLTAFDGADGDGHPLADGSVVFVSSRDGQNNVWRLAPGKTDADAAALTRLTAFAPLGAGGEASIGHGVRDWSVSPDGRWGVFCVWDTLYRIDLAAPAPRPEAVPLAAAADSADLDILRFNADRQVSEVALSPDGKTLALVARGEVYVRSTDEGRPTRRVTTTVGRERDLAWSPDGRVLYFASDDTGRYAIYGATVSLAREDIAPTEKDAEREKEKGDGEVQPPGDATGRPGAAADPAAPPPDKPPPDGHAGQPAADGADAKPAAPPRADKPARKPDHGKRWAEALRFNVELLASSADADKRQPLPSPDGKQLLYVHGLGDLVVRDLATGAERTVLGGWNEPETLWMPDSRHVIFAREDLDYNSDIWVLDTQPAADGSIPAPVNLTRHPDNDTSPRLSADGKVLYFLSERARGSDELDVWAVNLDRRLDGLRPYELDDYFKKAAEAAKKAKPLGAGDDKPASRARADESAKAPDSPDEPRKEAGPRDQAADAARKKPEPLRIHADDAYLRVRRLTSFPGHESDLAVTPGGDRVVLSAEVDGKRTLISVDFKGEDRKTLDTASPSSVRVSLTGEKVVYVKTGQAFGVPPGGGKVEAFGIDAPTVVRAADQQRQKFIEATRILGDRFYHPTLKGLDWAGLTRRYLSLAERTRTSDEFNRVLNTLWGELDGSHLGTMGGPAFSAPAPAVGFLGVDASPVPGGFRVDRVLRAGPADREPSRLNPGDVIVSIDGVALAPAADALPAIDLAAAMAGKAGKETLLEVRPPAPPAAPPPAVPPPAAPPPAAPAPAAGAAEHQQQPPPAADAGEAPAPPPAAGVRYVLIAPVSASDNDDLRYQDEVEARRAAVDRLSGGRLGYLHIRGMSEPSVRDFERDLFAAASGKAGLIIDVRDNGGGSTADILFASLTAPRHAWTMPRGVDPAAVPRDAYPRDRRLIYAWTRPINVLINENSFSNAEIFAHGVKTIGRGRLVGTATYGGVISTGAATLIDGTTIRTPFRGWYIPPDGIDMENHGAQPDVNVPQTPEDEAAGRDRQLEAAVEELLRRVGAP
jgi:tricorn protease